MREGGDENFPPPGVINLIFSHLWYDVNILTSSFSSSLVIMVISELPGEKEVKNAAADFGNTTSKARKVQGGRSFHQQSPEICTSILLETPFYQVLIGQQYSMFTRKLSALFFSFSILESL